MARPMAEDGVNNRWGRRFVQRMERAHPDLFQRLQVDASLPPDVKAKFMLGGEARRRSIRRRTRP
jgi:hypothetical protein